MKPAVFDYYAPDTLDQALALLAEHGDEAKPPRESARPTHPNQSNRGDTTWARRAEIKIPIVPTYRPPAIAPTDRWFSLLILASPADETT